jgi:uncharacterized heparinase superfamily protein
MLPISKPSEDDTQTTAIANLSNNVIAEKLPRLVLPRAMAFKAQRYRHTAVYSLWLRTRKSSKVSIFPLDPWAGSLIIGQKLIEGVLRVGKEEWAFSDAPWQEPRENPLPVTVHRFAWLRDLHTLGGNQARAKARNLVVSWIKTHKDLSHPAWTPEITAMRMVQWFSHYSFFGASSDKIVRSLLERSLTNHLHMLRHHYAALPDDERRFVVLKGILYGYACLEDFRGGFAASLPLLHDLITAQIDDDGSHKSNVAALHIRVLRDLLDIRALCHGQGITMPAFLQQTIEKMVDVVRFIRLGNGMMPQFHGSGFERRELLDTLLNIADSKAYIQGRRQALGIQKMQAGITTVLLDTTAQQQYASMPLCESTLAFEMTVGKEKIITSCGVSPFLNTAWQTALQQSVAHSGLTLNNRGAGVSPSVTVNRDSLAPNAHLEASHDGYARRFGIVHTRKIMMTDNGEHITGEDLLEGQGHQEVTLRFHLHPNIRAVYEQGKNKVYLDLPSRDLWTFQAFSGTITLAESVYFCHSGARLDTKQIVVQGKTNEVKTVFKWVLQKA